MASLISPTSSIQIKCWCVFVYHNQFLSLIVLLMASLANTSDRLEVCNACHNHEIDVKSSFLWITEIFVCQYCSAGYLYYGIFGEGVCVFQGIYIYQYHVLYWKQCFHTYSLCLCSFRTCFQVPEWWHSHLEKVGFWLCRFLDMFSSCKMRAFLSLQKCVLIVLSRHYTLKFSVPWKAPHSSGCQPQTPDSAHLEKATVIAWLESHHTSTGLAMCKQGQEIGWVQSSRLSSNCDFTASLKWYVHSKPLHLAYWNQCCFLPTALTL